MNFTLQREGGEVVQCTSCDMPVPLHDFGREGEPRLLCEFCSSSMASRHTEYPARDEYGQLRQEIWKAAAAVYNMLKHGDPGC